MSNPAFQAALRLLSHRDYFRQELVARLRRKRFADDLIEQAVARCIELGYLDDMRLTERFVELRAVGRGWGPLRLVAELKRRGVKHETAVAAVGRRGELFAEALQVALRRAEQRAVKGWWALHERQARMISSLIGRGFEADDAIQAVRELAALRENEHDGSENESGDPVSIS
jgi:regulatory protein